MISVLNLRRVTFTACFDILSAAHFSTCVWLYRMDETENFSKPLFGGTRGEEFESICEKVERSFAENLQAIRDVQQNILDVNASSWYDAIIR